MKVAVNDDWGGFGLSAKAIELYHQRKHGGGKLF